MNAVVRLSGLRRVGLLRRAARACLCWILDAELREVHWCCDGEEVVLLVLVPRQVRP